MNMIIWPLMTYTVTSFGKAFAHVRNCLLEKSTWHKQKHWRTLHENDTGGFSKPCVKIKNRCYTDLLHFSTRKHNLVSFFGWIVFWQNCIVVFYIFFFFQEKTLGYISFKLETKIMNFMSVFVLKNIIKTTQVLSMICNTICLQFSIYHAPL